MDVSTGAITSTEVPQIEAQPAPSSCQSADSSSISKGTMAENNGQIKRKISPKKDSRASNHSSIRSSRTLFSDDNQDDMLVERPPQHEDWGIGDDVKMGLG